MPYLDQALQAVLLCASITLHPRILFSRIPLNKNVKFGFNKSSRTKISNEAKEGRTCIQINIIIFQLKTSCISVNFPVPFTKNFYNLNINDLQRRKSFVKYCNLPLYIS